MGLDGEEGTGAAEPADGKADRKGEADTPSDAQIERIESAWEDLSTILVSAVGAAAYCLLAATTVERAALVGNDGTIELPVLGLAVSIHMFFLASTGILVVLHGYLLAHVDSWATLLRE